MCREFVWTRISSLIVRLLPPSDSRSSSRRRVRSRAISAVERCDHVCDVSLCSCRIVQWFFGRLFCLLQMLERISEMSARISEMLERVPEVPPRVTQELV